jgi:ParB family chromosome partitioning protein
MTETTTAPAMTLELIPPGDLLVRNIRVLDGPPDPDLVASIREHGIQQALAGIRGPDGRVTVRDGHGRRKAAIELGLPEVPVTVVDGDPDTPAAEVKRLFAQYDVNTVRAGLTATDKASFVVQVLDLGVDVEEVQRKARLGPDQVAAAQRVAKSKVARKAAAEHPGLDLEQCAAIGDFAGEPDAVKKLTEAAKDGKGQFAHVLQDARDRSAERAAAEAERKKLKADGVTVAKEPAAYDHQLDNLVTPAGKRLTVAAHKDCGGHRAHVSAQVPWQRDRKDRTPVVTVTYSCADPKAHGHKVSYSMGGGSSDRPKLTGKAAEEATEEIRRVKAGNKAWRAAQPVREEWLRQFLARKAPPAGALRFVLEAFARMDYAVQTGLTGGHTRACDLLGLKVPESKVGFALPNVVLAAVAGASDQRAQVIALAMVLGGYESAITDQTWRGPNEHIQRYFQALAKWGYPLSPIEQSVADGVRGKTPDWRDGQPAATPVHDSAGPGEEPDEGPLHYLNEDCEGPECQASEGFVTSTTDATKVKCPDCLSLMLVAPAGAGEDPQP